MPQVVVEINYKVNGVAVQMSHTYNAEGQIELAIPVAHSVANLQVELQFVRAKLNCLIMQCSKALNVFTNAVSGGSPDNTINIPAGGAWEWNDQSGIAITAALAADVTKIYVTNPGSTAADDTILYIRGMKDATPGT